MKIGNGYGLTEACGFATSNFGAEVVGRRPSVGRHLPVHFGAEVVGRRPSVGRHLPVVELSIRDEAGGELSVWRAAVLAVR